MFRVCQHHVTACCLECDRLVDGLKVHWVLRTVNVGHCSHLSPRGSSQFGVGHKVVGWGVGYRLTQQMRCPGYGNHMLIGLFSAACDVVGHVDCVQNKLSILHNIEMCGKLYFNGLGREVGIVVEILHIFRCSFEAVQEMLPSIIWVLWGRVNDGGVVRISILVHFD